MKVRGDQVVIRLTRLLKVGEGVKRGRIDQMFDEDDKEVGREEVG